MLRQSGKDTFQILKHVVVPEPQNPEIVLDEPAVADGIPLGVGMLSAVDLDNESRCEAEKIRNVGSKGNLTAEFEIREPAISHGEP